MEELAGEGGGGGEGRGGGVSHGTHLHICVDILNLMPSRKVRQLMVMRCCFAFV